MESPRSWIVLRARLNLVEDREVSAPDGSQTCGFNAWAVNLENTCLVRWSPVNQNHTEVLAKENDCLFWCLIFSVLHFEHQFTNCLSFNTHFIANVIRVNEDSKLYIVAKIHTEKCYSKLKNCILLCEGLVCVCVCVWNVPKIKCV